MQGIILGRDKEILELKQLVTSNKAEFLAIYGRRRVGKTFLIRRFFEDSGSIFLNVTGTKNGTLREQIKHFTKQMAITFFQGAPLENKKNWDDVLSFLTETIQKMPKNKKIVLFFDELPWLATRNSRLLQQLDYYWNQHWSNDERVKLIVCGSSASWIIKKIINDKGGLHNRVTRTISLEPFNLDETKRFLAHKKIKLNHDQILQIYMVMGGIPDYLARIDKGLSASQIIEKLAFSKNSFLLKEFDNLFSSLFDEHEIYIKILRLIAQYREGIGQEILLNQLDKALQGQGGLEKLKALEDAGFIICFKPQFHKRRGIYYKLIDEYTLFYFDWIEPVRQTLQERALETGNWQALQNSPGWNNWLGYAFEAICYKHISQIRNKLQISPTAIANSWRYRPETNSEASGAQIDLLFNRTDNSITLCEIKYSTQPFVIDKNYAKNLANKKDMFARVTRTKKQLFTVMVAVHGIKHNTYSDDLIDGIVTLDDLFLKSS